MSLQIGDKLLERFEITRALSSGGMGSVYEAKDRTQGSKRCAIKMMLPHLIAGKNAELFRTRFRAEIKLLERLTHPGIPRFITSLENETGFFLVMEFVQGRNLEQELEERMRLTGAPFPLDQALRDARQILEVLQNLHSFDPPLVHRDIKPANLIREHPSGKIKLVDFGLARSLDAGPATQTQIGTLGYAPLEQLQGRAEVRSDLYALGATLHHLLSGEAPKPLDIGNLATLRPDLPADLVAWINKAIAMDANNRFPTAQAMLNELNALESVKGRLEVPRPSATRPDLPDLSSEPTRIFTAAPSTNIIEPTLPKDPVVEVPLEPPAPLPPRAESLEAVVAETRPGSKGNLAWGGLLLLGIAVAFWAGRHTTREPLSPAPSPAVAATTPVLAVPTPTPAVAVVKPDPPTHAPSPIVVHNRPSFLRQQAAQAKRATPTPGDGEEHQQYSLNGPSYPTHTAPSVPTAPKKTPRPNHHPQPGGYSAPADRFDPLMNLPDEWSKVSSMRGSTERLIAFQKPGPSYNSPVRFTVRTYLTQQPKNRIQQSFNALRTGWSPKGDLPAVDQAMERNAHGTQEVEALVTRPGRYYLLRVECHGGVMPPEQFQKEVLEALGGVEIP